MRRQFFGAMMKQAGGASPIVTTGLVLNFDASNPASYPGSGTAITDLSGNGNNGTLINGVGYSATNGGILTFDGVNDYVNTSLITPLTAFSYGVWAKTSVSGNFANRVMGNANSDSGNSGSCIILGAQPNKFYVIRRASGASYDFYSSTITNFSGNWHYIVHTYDSINGSKAFCDNVQVGSNASIGFTSLLPFRVGRDGNGADAFNGSVGAVQVYNKALTVGEIDQNFNADKTRFGL